MSEYDDIPLKLPDGGMDDSDKKMEPSESKPGQMGLALKRAMNGSNGEAIEEMIKKICDSMGM
jgi:hypothetical protein